MDKIPDVAATIAQMWAGYSPNIINLFIFNIKYSHKHSTGSLLLIHQTNKYQLLLNFCIALKLQEREVIVILSIKYCHKQISFYKNIIVRLSMAHNKTTLFHEQEGDGFYLAQFKTPFLSIFSYYIESKGQALLIDPILDVNEYETLAKKRNGKIISILLTHYQTDYVAGHLEYQLPIIMGPKSKINSKLKIYQMKDGYSFNLGQIWFKILYTPGHTPDSTCFRLFDKNKKQFCMFSGDTLFLGEVGHPDLTVSGSFTKQQLTKILFSSLMKIKQAINPEVRVYPTHGTGSLMGKNISDGNYSTLRKQLENNYALRITNEEQFIEKITTGMPKLPQYFSSAVDINKNGHSMRYFQSLGSSEKGLSPQQFKKYMDNGATVIDTREDFKRISIKGSYLIPEHGPFANFVGMIISPRDKILLICTKDKQRDILQKMLLMGFTNLCGYADFSMQVWIDKGYEVTIYKIVNGPTLAADQKRNILDVRNLPEWKAGIVENAHLISLPEIKQRGNEVKDIPNLYVHCRTGLRARLATSILAQKGIQTTLVVDKVSEFPNYGLKMIPHQ